MEGPWFESKHTHMFFTYVLKSSSTGRHYIGSTQDLELRLQMHNQNRVRSTRSRGPWRIIYTEMHTNRVRAQAVRRELEIKSYKNLTRPSKKLLLTKSVPLHLLESPAKWEGPGLSPSTPHVFTYVLKSSSTGRHYIGSTQDLELRLQMHNQNRVRSTRSRGPWRIIYTEMHTNRAQAVRRELEIKSYKSGQAFKNCFWLKASPIC